MQSLTVNLHLHDTDVIEVKRMDGDIGRPYYVLRLGAVSIFLDPPRLAELAREVATYAAQERAQALPEAV